MKTQAISAEILKFKFQQSSKTENTLPSQDLTELRQEVVGLLNEIKQSLGNFFQQQGFPMPDTFSMQYQHSYLSVDSSQMQKDIETQLNQDSQIMSKFNHVCAVAKNILNMEKNGCHHRKMPFDQILMSSMDLEMSVEDSTDNKTFNFELSYSRFRMQTEGALWLSEPA